MTVRAAVFCETADPPGLRGLRGIFEFEAAPRAGEDIVLRYGRRSDLFHVTRVGHDIRVQSQTGAADGGDNDDDCFRLWIYVTWVREKT